MSGPSLIMLWFRPVVAKLMYSLGFMQELATKFARISSICLKSASRTYFGEVASSCRMCTNFFLFEPTAAPTTRMPLSFNSFAYSFVFWRVFLFPRGAPSVIMITTSSTSGL